MAFETVFLFVLVLALVIGNVLLSFIPSNGKKNDFEQNNGFDREDSFEQNVLSSSTQEQIFEKSDLSKEEAQTKVLFSNFTALNQKINLANNQLDLISEKLRKLDNFKVNTEVELKGMKEIIVELQDKYLTTSSKKIKKGINLSTKEMQKIIYRSK